MMRIRRFCGVSEVLEGRQLLASDTGAMAANLVAQPGRTKAAVVIQFTESLNAASASSVANYRVDVVKTGSNPAIVTTSGQNDRVVAAVYDDALQQVKLTLAKPLKPGRFFRVSINGTPNQGLVSGSGLAFDGDADYTPGGNFAGIVSGARSYNFVNATTGERTLLSLKGPGGISLYRDLNGNVKVLTVTGNIQSSTTVSGRMYDSTGNVGDLVTPVIQANGASNNVTILEGAAGNQPVSPQPIVANASNLPYTIQITPVDSIPAPAIQSADHAQANGLWLVFGGRTNGLHGFDSGAGSGTSNFPPSNQNNDIYVIDPATGHVWTEAWSATGLPVSVWKSLASSNQEYYQSGDKLYAAGGYSQDPTTGQFVTYDTLSSVSVSGLINAVINQGSAAGQVKQIHGDAFRVTGGDMNTTGNRTFLMFGQDFEGGYQDPSSSQVYTNQIRSFTIVDKGNTLAIKNYQAQFDPVNYRRRDGNLSVQTVLPNGKLGINGLGGVFTINSNPDNQTGYQQPVLVGANGIGAIDSNYKQFFSQYSGGHVALYDSRTGTTDTLLLGGISLYNYDPSTGALTSDTGLPFVNDVTTLSQNRSGAFQEYIMPNQLPSNLGPFHNSGETNLYGAGAAFFANPDIPVFKGEVLDLARINGPTTLGYMYGGIVADTGNFGNSVATGAVFKITITPA